MMEPLETLGCHLNILLVHGCYEYHSTKYGSGDSNEAVNTIKFNKESLAI